MEQISQTLNTEKHPHTKFELVIGGTPLTPIDYDLIPEDVIKHFEAQSSKFILPEQYQPKNFRRLYTFIYQNGDIGYISEQDKTYDTTGDTERLTYFEDVRDGTRTGYLELRYGLSNKDTYFKGKPFVGFTRTLDGFQNEGLGERRLRVANAYSLDNYGVPLNSDTLIEKTAKRVWERLVEKGEAEKYMEGKNERFRFILKS
ncbi:MAG: hypothetical protein HGA67_02345 [Candidatus Yonathbacteria bacterium]|nr:hypothetical protein [Candidatus Yonathbacteria bacterium]